jgi:Protein of unknown function (DUF3180)
VRPVPRRDLVVLAVGLAVATFVLVRSFYGDLPPLHWWLGVPIGLLGVAEALGARTLRIRLEAEREARSRRPSTAVVARRDAATVRPVEPMLVARVAVLAQASAYVGAGFTGLWIGVLLHVGPAVGRLSSAAGDTVTSAVGAVLAVGLTVAALRLEAVCRVPPRGGSREDEPGRPDPA